MKERLQRQLHPEARKALSQAQRLAGKEPVIKQVPPLPGDIKAQLVRPHIAGRPYEIHVVRGQERVTEHRSDPTGHHLEVGLIEHVVGEFTSPRFIKGFGGWAVVDVGRIDRATVPAGANLTVNS